MCSNIKPLMSMTAADLMTVNVVQLAENMPLCEAARRLVVEGISGAPVVDLRGVCVGVLSSSDFLQFLAYYDPQNTPSAMTRPPSCSFQRPIRDRADNQQVACAVPFGTCPVQFLIKSQNGDDVIGCNKPHGVFVEWKVVEMEDLPHDEVRNYMTHDVVTVATDDSIRAISRRMLDAHIHRVIVVDDSNRPIGIVSSTDILAAVSAEVVLNTLQCKCPK